MVKKLTYSILAIISLASCSNMRPLTASGRASSAPVESKSDKNIRFLDDISMNNNTTTTAAAPAVTKTEPARRSSHSGNQSAPIIVDRPSTIEKMSAIHLKYAVLLNMEVEQLSVLQLLPFVDEWFGTKYRLGGNSHSGIDCSAFTQAVYSAAFGVNLPRTAREQYKESRIVSTTEIKEGDLVFFNTRGGVSHVGIYLANNKFIHASTSNGVTVSDLFDPYYMKRFLGSGRIEKPDITEK